MISALEKVSQKRNVAALKQLHQPEDSRDPERSAERMAREIDAMRLTDHDHLLRIIDVDPQKQWYVSEFHPLGALSKRPIPPFKGNALSTLRALRPVIAAVQEQLHAKRIVHRDIKPDNIFITESNTLVLGDFGLVYFIDSRRTRLSATLENVGSRDWMPPWAYSIRVGEIRPTFDVFAFGKVIWSLYSGLPLLPLWYYTDPPYNVEKLFPEDPYAKVINWILQMTVVQREENCLADAATLLDVVDRAIRTIERGAGVFPGATTRRCRECGIGSYRLLQAHDHRESGMPEPSGNRAIKAFSCDHCGNVQLFLGGTHDKPVALWDAVQ